MGALEKTRQELDATKLRLSTTQQSLHERDGHLNSLRQERRKQLEEILEMKLVSLFFLSVFALLIVFSVQKEEEDEHHAKYSIQKINKYQDTFSKKNL